MNVIFNAKDIIMMGSISVVALLVLVREYKKIHYRMNDYSIIRA